ncbi:hypothetical protein CHKEEEPN_4760 [Methylorubrum podarium]|nr:hypothetical protein CHKEEEPN_4760 [Methylorubrum podarium]
MFADFVRLVFVEQCEDLPDHDADGVIAHFLRHRDKSHASFRETADVHFLQERIAHEAAKRMHQHHVEG